MSTTIHQILVNNGQNSAEMGVKRRTIHPKGPKRAKVGKKSGEGQCPYPILRTINPPRAPEGPKNHQKINKSWSKNVCFNDLAPGSNFLAFLVKKGTKNHWKTRGKLDWKNAETTRHIKVWTCSKHCKLRGETHIFKKSKKWKYQKCVKNAGKYMKK